MRVLTTGYGDRNIFMEEAAFEMNPKSLIHTHTHTYICIYIGRDEISIGTNKEIAQIPWGAFEVHVASFGCSTDQGALVAFSKGVMIISILQ